MFQSDELRISWSIGLPFFGEGRIPIRVVVEQAFELRMRLIWNGAAHLCTRSAEPSISRWIPRTSSGEMDCCPPKPNQDIIRVVEFRRFNIVPLSTPSFHNKSASTISSGEVQDRSVFFCCASSSRITPSYSQDVCEQARSWFYRRGRRWPRLYRTYFVQIQRYIRSFSHQCNAAVVFPQTPFSSLSFSLQANTSSSFFILWVCVSDQSTNL